jgi:hypothetical protein
MTALTHQLPAEIESYLDRFAARRRVQRLLRAVAQAALLTIVWILACCVGDRLGAFPASLRVVLLAINVVLVIALLARPLMRMFRLTDPRRVASAIERREPALAQKLSTVTSRALGPAEWGGSKELLAALMQQVAQQVRGRDPSALLPWRGVLSPAAACFFSIAVAGLLGTSSWLDLPTLARRYAMPQAPIAPVTSTRIAVAPGDLAVPAGESLVVRVEILRGDETPPTLHLRMPGGAWHEQAMSLASDRRFESRVRELERSIDYFVTAGDASSRTFSAEALPRPAVTRFRMRFDYPAYTGLQPREADNTTGTIEAPVGTEVTLLMETTEPLSRAVLTIGGESMIATPTADAAVRQARFTVRQDKRFTLRMVSNRGASGVFRGGTIRAVPDRPPIVWLRENGERLVASGDVIELAYQTLDDYGLARLDAEVQVERQSGARADAVVAIALNEAREHKGTVPLDLSRLGLKVGDRVEVRLRGEDRAGQFALSEVAPMQVMRETAAKPPAPAATPLAKEPASPAAQSPPLDPPGYGQAIRAYFEALRKGISPPSK